MHARAVVDAIADTYGVSVLEPAVPKTVRFAEAPALGRSILATARRHRGAEAYRELARRLDAQVPTEPRVAQYGDRR